MMAIFNFFRELFAKTIGDQPIPGGKPGEASLKDVGVSKGVNAGKERSSPEATLLANGANTGNKGAGKRQWWKELDEFFLEHLLSVRNHDPNGITEKLTIAWATPATRRLRKLSNGCWGPYGMFFNQYGTKESFYAACLLDLGATLIALGIAVLLLRPYLFFLSLILTALGLYIIIDNMTEVDF